MKTRNISLVILFQYNKANEQKRYLVRTLAYGVNQFLDDHVHTLDTRLLQLYDLLLHDGFKCHVWGEKSSPESHEKYKKRDDEH